MGVSEAPMVPASTVDWNNLRCGICGVGNGMHAFGCGGARTRREPATVDANRVPWELRGARAALGGREEKGKAKP